ncbi:TetR/AcrR family transcriptional regulator [Rhizobium leguminosarum]|uniref:TetR/AcrR family transcriptional regulator n=1 Tax=Rhizobium leguminosarum TaxID=384 RepID=UPI001C97F7C3|nr:TetR/AcrR family transcriptional regulator [Rhizobium leguminosarum]MBY5431015.1 TetR/AcrR family transcriptional regulator [Rhizobium leguminosarum]
MRANESQEILRKPRIRMAPSARRELILAEATDFFAQYGFDGATRDLADKIGIKQPLIYRYFPSKESLVREVFNAVCRQRFHGEWRRHLDDLQRPIRERFTAFYKEFLAATFHPTATRIFLFAGLARLSDTKEFSTFVEDTIFTELAKHLRSHLKLLPLPEAPLNETERAVLWLHHGGICFHGIRTELYLDQPFPETKFIEASVDAMIKSYPRIGE